MEGFFHPNGLAMKVMNWITDMCQIQLLWLLYTLRGCIVLGFFPATRAMVTVHRQLIVKKESLSLVPAFKETYDNHFKTSNQLGYIMIVVGGFLIVYLRSTLLLTATVVPYFLGLAYALIAFFILLNLYVLVMLSHLTLETRKVWKQAILIIFLSPVHTLLILLVFFGFLAMTRVVPVLVPVILVAIFSYCVTYIALHAITKISCHY